MRVVAVEPATQVWIEKLRVFEWRDWFAVELHPRCSFGFSVWRSYVALFCGPLVVSVGRRPITNIEGLDEHEWKLIEGLRSFDEESA